MKKVMMTIAVVIMLMGISDKVQAQAGPWTRSAFGLGARHRCGGYSYRSVLGRSSWTRSAFGLGRYGSYGRYGGYGGYGYGRDRTLRRVTGYGRLALGALDMIDQRSINNRLVNHQISVDNRIVSMAERDQQIRAQVRTPRKRVLVSTDPAIYVLVPVDSQVKTKLEKTQEKKIQTQENEKIQQDFSKIVSEMEVKSPEAYRVYLDQRFADQSQEASLKKALETLKKENKDVYYALLKQMYEN